MQLVWETGTWGSVEGRLSILLNYRAKLVTCIAIFLLTATDFKQKREKEGWKPDLKPFNYNDSSAIYKGHRNVMEILHNQTQTRNEKELAETVYSKFLIKKKFRYFFFPFLICLALVTSAPVRPENARSVLFLEQGRQWEADMRGLAFILITKSNITICV